MASDTSWQPAFPNLDEPVSPDEAAVFAQADEVDTTLRRLADSIDNRYQTHHIEAQYTKTTRPLPGGQAEVVYALYLVFAGRNYYSYRLFELLSQRANGGLPVTVQAFSAPPEAFEVAATLPELQDRIDRILSHTRTRWLINTNYKP